MMHRLSKTALVGLVGLLLATAGLVAPQAAAASGCGERVLDEAVKRNKIADYHAQSCYRWALDAIKDVPDIIGYTNVENVLRRAMARDRAADDRMSPSGGDTGAQSSGSAKPSTGTGSRAGSGTRIGPDRPTRSQASNDPLLAAGGGDDDGDGQGPFSHAVGTGLGASGANDFPPIVIVLGVLASLLLLAGVASLLVRRRLQARGPGAPPL